MDFLSYNRDVLSEISKYLSRRDLRNIKFAFPSLDLQKEYTTKVLFMKQRVLAPPSAHTIYYSLVSIMTDLFNSKYDSFLIYNRTYDPETRILTCDLDYREIFCLYHVSTLFRYRDFVCPIIVCETMLIRIRNGHDCYRYCLEKRLTINSRLICEDYIHYLIEEGKIVDFINQHLDDLSKIENYLLIYGYGFIFILPDTSMNFIVNNLPEVNRNRLRESTKEFIKNNGINASEYPRLREI